MAMTQHIILIWWHSENEDGDGKASSMTVSFSVNLVSFQMEVEHFSSNQFSMWTMGAWINIATNNMAVHKDVPSCRNKHELQHLISSARQVSL
jgi:hypothetical protein